MLIVAKKTYAINILILNDLKQNATLDKLALWPVVRRSVE